MNQHPHNYPDAIIATDTKEQASKYSFVHSVGKQYDFASPYYTLPIDTHIDYIITQLPRSFTIPFALRTFKVAERGILLLGGLQLLQRGSGHKNIFKDNPPPSDIFFYTDEVQNKISDNCAWYFWDLENKPEQSKIHWINKK